MPLVAMRIFVYEFITGGGTLCDPELGPPRGALLMEGSAMVNAIAADLAELDGAEVVVMRDWRVALELPPRISQRTVTNCDAEANTFVGLLQSCDLTLVLAPEINGHLANRTERAELAGAELICPSSHFVKTTSDKELTVQALRRAGIPVPDDADLDRLPFVQKPRDGAGSLGVRLVEDVSSLPTSFDRFRVECYVPGLSASVGLLCGGGRLLPLPPFQQLVEAENRFAYRGGRTITDARLCQRAQRLAVRAIEALPPCRGYVGVDLVMGEAEDGSDDCVIEVNPRLTTSYVGLRHLARQNLGLAMFHAAMGQPFDLQFVDRAIEFEPSGRIIEL